MRAFCLLSIGWLCYGTSLLAADKANRSPVDLVLGPNTAWLATANQTSSTVSLVDPATSKVLQEVPVGKHPTAIIRDSKGERLFVSGRDAGTITILRITDNKLEPAGVIDVGFHPHGLALSPDEKRLYVALTASDQVGIVDLSEQKQKLIKKVDTGRWPRWLALAPDGKKLAVATSGDRGLCVIDCEQEKQVFAQAFAGLNIGHLQMSRDGKQVYFPWMVYRQNTITAGNIRLGWVLASRIGRLKVDDPDARREAFSLDPQGKAIADVHGLALTPDERRLVVSAAGTHELLVYQHEGLPFKDYGGTDHIDPALLADSNRFARIELGGRPLGLRIADDNRTVFVANYLTNAVQVVDLDGRKILREILLGGEESPTLARQGEAIFYDARRSLDQWYSCHTCHYEGGTSGERMDTLNDGTRNTPKTVLSLYNFHDTGPWTWHGWQKDARAAMRKSLTETMLGPAPTGADIDAMLAYLSELKRPPNPFRKADGSLTETAARGEIVFRSDKAGCANCHSGPHFTDGQVHDVGLSARGDAYRGYNTPTLVGVYERAKLLHDGRAKSLAEVLKGDHNPAKVTGSGELTDTELADLIEYLKSL